MTQEEFNAFVDDLIAMTTEDEAVIVLRIHKHETNVWFGTTIRPQNLQTVFQQLSEHDFGRIMQKGKPNVH